MSHYYTTEIKMQAVRMYRQGKGCATIGRKLGVHKSQVQRWINLYNANGKACLSSHNRHVPVEKKKAVVLDVLGKCLSCEQAALKYCVGRSSLARWVAMVRQSDSISVLEGCERKTGIQMGRPRKQEPQTELEKLKLENEYLKAEVALLKKMQALLDRKKAQNKGTGRAPSAS